MKAELRLHQPKGKGAELQEVMPLAGSVGKGACHRGQQLDTLRPHSGRREQSPISCSLTSTPVSRKVYPYTYTQTHKCMHRHKQIKVFINFLKKKVPLFHTFVTREGCCLYFGNDQLRDTASRGDNRVLNPDFFRSQ